MKASSLFLAFLLIGFRSGYTQSATPQGALEEMVTTDKIEVMKKHLPLKIVEILNSLDAKEKAEAEKELLIGKKMEEKGVKLRRSDDGKSWEVVRNEKPAALKGPGEPAMNAGKQDDVPAIVVTIKSTFISGNDALLMLDIRQEDHPQGVLIGMKLEDGEWRLSSIGELHNLDSEEFLESMIHVRNPHTDAASMLRTLNTSLVTYCSTYPQLGWPSNLGQLATTGAKDEQASPEHAQLLDESFTVTPLIRHGYEYQYTLVRQGKNCEGEYRITATPVELGKSGNRSYFTDQSAVIRATKEQRPANENDPPL